MKAADSAAGISLVHFVAAIVVFMLGLGSIGWLFVGLGWFFLAVSYICSVIERKGKCGHE